MSAPPFRTLALGFRFLFLPLLLIVYAHGQAPAENTADQKAPSTNIVTNVDEVSIDIVVHKKGKAVLDLKPEDIAVTDDGSPVKLSDLQVVNAAPGTNHLVTVLFDPLNPSAATNARQVAAKILKIFPAQGFEFSVYKMEGRLRLLQEFTSDRTRLQNAIRIATDADRPIAKAASDSEQALIAAVQSGVGGTRQNQQQQGLLSRQAELACLTEWQRVIQAQHTTPSIAALIAVSRSQTRIPGRKLLIYFTGGLPPSDDTKDMLRSVSGAANRAEVSLFVIGSAALDSKVMEGLMASAAMGSMSAFTRSNASGSQPGTFGSLNGAQIPNTFSGGMIFPADRPN